MPQEEFTLTLNRQQLSVLHLHYCRGLNGGDAKARSELYDMIDALNTSKNKFGSGLLEHDGKIEEPRSGFLANDLPGIKRRVRGTSRNPNLEESGSETPS